MLFVQPFDVKVGGTTMNVSGSNGFDQSLQYTLGLKVPRSMMGGAANSAIAGLVSKAGAAGVDLAAAPEIQLGIKLGGTVTSPTVAADVSSLASSVTKGAEQAVKQAVTEKVDSAGMRLVQEAEQKAAQIRKEGQAAADQVKKAGYAQADSLTAKASGPLAKMAAGPAADALRKQSDSKAAGNRRRGQQAGRRAGGRGEAEDGAEVVTPGDGIDALGVGPRRRSTVARCPTRAARWRGTSGDGIDALGVGPRRRCSGLRPGEEVGTRSPH